MKGQITLFVIIGIVILLIVGVAYYYRESIISGLRGDIGEKVSQSLEEQEIREYVAGCVEKVAREAVDIVGLQGGYILVPLDVGVNQIDNLVLFGDLNIPLWFYDKENNVQRVNVPSLEDIENEIGEYIDVNLARCTSYRLFEDYDIKEGAAKSNVKIRNNLVDVNVNFPVSVKTKKSVFNLDNFNVEIEAPLGELYSVAKEIFEKEDKNHLLEERTFDMMVVYDEIPVSGTELECGIRTWQTDQVEKDLKKLIVNNIPYIKIKDTEHGDVDKYMEWDLLKKRHDNLRINLMYLEDWPFYLEVFPDEDGVLKSDNVISGNQFNQFLMGLFCVNSYNFVYDVKYPLVFILNKDDYTFQFGMEVIIDNNQPRENRYEVLDFEGLSEACKIRDKEIEVYAIDNEGNDVDGNLFYRCGGYKCSLGEVKKGYLKTGFPSCYNGEVIVENMNYTTGRKEFSSNKEKSVEIVLRPLHELNYKVRLIDKATGVIKDVKDEQVLIQLKTGDYSVSLAESSGKIKLVEGNYNIRAQVFDDTGVKFTVDKRDIEKCVDVPKGWIGTLTGLTEEKCVKTEVPKVEIEQMLIGGNNFNWGIDKDELFDAEKIIFYVIVDRRPKKVNDLSEVYDSLEGNDQSRFFLYPELK